MEARTDAVEHPTLLQSVTPNKDSFPVATTSVGAAQDGTKPFLGCAYCNEAFPETKELEVHVHMQHPGVPVSSIPAPLPEREVALLQKPFAAISKGIPLSEVERHCVPEDCWVALNGKVYDLSEFMDRHPGGPTTILSWAGKDASKFFNDIHKGIKVDLYLRPEAFVGSLGVDEELMSDDLWHCLRKARIEQVKEELERVRAEVPPEPAASVTHLLQAKGLSVQVRERLQSLETQKRVALELEDYERAQEIKNRVDALLADSKLQLEPAPQTPKTSKGVPLSEVATHNKPHDCWVALNGVVYDLTDVIIEHPEQRNAILAWAGRDATPMWDRIPGRFPSTTWFAFFSRPEFSIFDVAEEPPVDGQREAVRRLEAELRSLEGPSEEDIRHAKEAAAARAPPPGAEPSKLSEEARFPRLKDITAGKELPFFTRAEVAKHKGPAGGPPGTEPYMILHNKVYDLTPLLGFHPGGDEMLLTRAGTDATKDFELFDHSEKARVKRDQEMLVGEIVPGEHIDWAAEAAEGAAAGGAQQALSTSQLAKLYFRGKALDIVVLALIWYARKSYQHRKPLSKLMYSRGLRHLHLIMALGIFGALGSAQAASRSEGLMKKRWLAIHKQTGLAMFFALIVRIFVRLRSGIPPRFPGHPAVKAIETLSLRAFYVLLFALPVSGMANEYFLKWAPAEEKADDDRNDRLARQAIDIHKQVGKFFQFAWLPFHLGYTTAYHWSRGRGVVRKVSPFI